MEEGEREERKAGEPVEEGTEADSVDLKREDIVDFRSSFVYWGDYTRAATTDGLIYYTRTVALKRGERVRGRE